MSAIILTPPAREAAPDHVGNGARRRRVKSACSWCAVALLIWLGGSAPSFAEVESGVFVPVLSTPMVNGPQLSGARGSDTLRLAASGYRSGKHNVVKGKHHGY
jgi:hypothetical protein